MYGDYLRLLPQYRGCADLHDVQIQRAVFGFVPNWHDQPLAPLTSRLLHIGDAAGNRSALSFAGALARLLSPAPSPQAVHVAHHLGLCMRHGKRDRACGLKALAQKRDTHEQWQAGVREAETGRVPWSCDSSAYQSDISLPDEKRLLWLACWLCCRV